MSWRSAVLALPFRLRQEARQAHKATQCRIVIAWQPNGAELKRGVSAGDWTENHVRKRRRNGRLAGEAHTSSDRDKVHHRLAADVRLLHARRASPVGEVFDQPFT